MKTAMCMDQDANGWKVDPVKISRPGEESYSLATNAPSATDGRPLPRGNPFGCSVPQPVNGEMEATLSFAEAYVQPWHDHSRDPFDNRRTVRLLLDIEGGGQEELDVSLSCLKMDHPQPKPSLLSVVLQAVVTVVVAIVQFFTQLFGVSKPGSLTPRV